MKVTAYSAWKRHFISKQQRETISVREALDCGLVNERVNMSLTCSFSFTL